MEREALDQVRRFNRLVSRRIGALEDSYLARGRPLGQARLVWELGAAGGLDLQHLRAILGVDSGYLSRLLRALEEQGLVETSVKSGDGRARVVSLTGAGIAEYRAYEALSDEQAGGVLAPLDAQRRTRLVQAMGEVERLLRAASIDLSLEDAQSGDARHCLQSYYAELAERFENGFDPHAVANFEPSEMTPPKGWFLMAREEGLPVGCGVLKRLEEDVGEIKRVWTAPAARGLGVATAIMDRLEALAAEAGFAAVRLDTNGALVEAQAMYTRRGYHPIPRYNDNPYAQHWFEKAM
ncbi:MAG: bifunctional helix-turn-helix transcriptional regulator/GNAT family N-acetyltransferase [Rhizobiaceae bacterium]|nr:bifunctional helix-turn-helix transcriptional regulator/GNAT family N-acetyltransferase [Rhizobiaceae bacterium]MCV0406943.1 bifunctional helix-turn-helix transcriptional regulator/GNAT family N-acetyltransferase [Rhizobiaceae bacterium]